MPNSPSIKFKIENNNLEMSTPLTGVSMVLARTTRGPYNDPSNLISTVSQFRSIYGEETVPDGSPSNIETALKMGSKLRIIRVPGNGYFKGVMAIPEDDTPPVKPMDPPTPESIMRIESGDDYAEIGFYTTTYDEKVDGSDNFLATFSKSGNTIFCSIYAFGKTTVLEKMPVITFSPYNEANGNPTTVDYLALYNFFTTSNYLEPTIVDSNVAKDYYQLVKWLEENIDGSNKEFSVTINGNHLGDSLARLGRPLTETIISIPGSSGTEPLASQWIDSLEYARDYTDQYHLSCSHIDQWLTSQSDLLSVHQAAKLMADELDEFMYFIEVPKYTTHFVSGMEVRDKASIITWIKTCMGTIGNSKNVAYFAGGIMMNDANGIPTASDVLGTVLGLADASASNYGPWLSFAGVNRGVIYDGNGPACPNYGSPSRYNDLNDLALSYANMIVVKDTPNAGKQTVLWHCFTSQIKQDSFKFISIVQLVYYLKKFIRPILESKIEEPNYIPTWKDIYLLVKPTLDDLVEREAMSEYTWMGDQNATGYDDMQVNKEADVRSGKYKAILKFKEIVPMQDIEMVLSIDKVARATTVELTNS